MIHKKIAIIILYNPKIDKIKLLNKNIAESGFYTIFVDNSSEKTSANWLVNGELIYNNKNEGIAKAQNIGLNRAKELFFEKVVFFDQDSEIDENFLLKLEKKLKDNLIIAPMIINKKTGKEYLPQKINRFGIAKEIKEGEIIADIIISSGTMTTREIIEKNGNFDETLFIDFVDIEWCLRARKNRIKIEVNREVVLNHMIGDKNIKLFPFLTLNIHSPSRTYYKVRNSLLIFRKNMGFFFCLHQSIVALIHNFLLIFYMNKKKEYIENYILGIYHGIINKSGSNN